MSISTSKEIAAVSYNGTVIPLKSGGTHSGEQAFAYPWPDVNTIQGEWQNYVFDQNDAEMKTELITLDYTVDRYIFAFITSGNSNSAFFVDGQTLTKQNEANINLSFSYVSDATTLSYMRVYAMHYNASTPHQVAFIYSGTQITLDSLDLEECIFQPIVSYIDKTSM